MTIKTKWLSFIVQFGKETMRGRRGTLAGRQDAGHEREPPGRRPVHRQHRQRPEPLTRTSFPGRDPDDGARIPTTPRPAIRAVQAPAQAARGAADPGHTAVPHLPHRYRLERPRLPGPPRADAAVPRVPSPGPGLHPHAGSSRSGSSRRHPSTSAAIPMVVVYDIYKPSGSSRRRRRITMAFASTSASSRTPSRRWRSSRSSSSSSPRTGPPTASPARSSASCTARVWGTWSSCFGKRRRPRSSYSDRSAHATLRRGDQP